MNKGLKTGTAALATALAILTATACSGNGDGSGGNGGNGGNGQAATSPSSASSGATADGEEGLQPEAGAKLLIWESKEARPFVERIMKEFTDKYGVEVRMEEVGTMDQVGKLALDGPAGSGADVITTSQDLLGQAASAGLIIPNDVFADATRKENEQVAVEAATFKDKLYGYPIKVMTYAMFYNKKLIAEPPKTMEDVVKFAETFNDPKHNKYAFMFDTPYFYFSYPFLGSTGGYIFGNKGTDPSDLGLDTAEAVKGMEAFAGLRKILPVSAADIASDIKTTLFSEGKVAMNVTGSWFIDTFRQAGVDFGVAPIPDIGGKPSVTLSQVNSWYVSSYSKYPNAAKLFARFASGKEAQLLNYSLTGSVPTNSEAAKDSAIQNDEIARAFYEQFSRSYPAPSIPEIGTVWVPMDAAMVQIWDGQDPKQVLGKAAGNIRDAIELMHKQAANPEPSSSGQAEASKKPF